MVCGRNTNNFNINSASNCNTNATACNRKINDNINDTRSGSSRDIVIALGVVPSGNRVVKAHCNVLCNTWNVFLHRVLRRTSRYRRGTDARLETKGRMRNQMRNKGEVSNQKGTRIRPALKIGRRSGNGWGGIGRMEWTKASGPGAVPRRRLAANDCCNCIPLGCGKFVERLGTWVLPSAVACAGEAHSCCMCRGGLSLPGRY